MPLAIEVGRFRGIPEDLLLCGFCDLQVVEDEVHFVFHGPLYGELRNCLFESIQLKNPDLFWKYAGETLSGLLENYVFVLARLMEKAWHLRQSTLYPV